MSDAFLVAFAGGTIVRFEAHDGRLRETTRARTGPALTALTLSPDGRRLYASVRSVPSVEMFDIEPDGTLTPVGSLGSPVPLVYLSTSPDGRTVFGSSYGDGHLVALAADGSRQQAVPVGLNPHCAVPDGDLVWVALLGEDAVLRIPAGDGVLDPARAHRAAVPAGFGPRHLVLTEQHAFVLGERSGTVARLSRSGDAALGSHWPVIPVDLDLAPGIVRGPGSNPDTDEAGRPLIWAADLAVSADGRLLYTSERRTSTLAVSSIAEARLLRTVETEPQPRAIGLGGAHLLATGERAESVSLYDRDLTLLDRVPAPPGAIWVEPVSA